MFKFPKGFGLGYAQVFNKGDEGFILPLLVVGANVYMRDMFAPELLKEWDLHIFFFPTQDETFRLGILGMSRKNESVFFQYGEASSTEDAIGNALFPKIEAMALHSKAYAWLTNSVYRCPKISLKDVLALEPYKKVA